jgi:tRNA(Ile)-lysidine synthase TilS/MesJ/sulfur carrier protein ThiS
LFSFVDRLNKLSLLEVSAGERVESLLLRNQIPPASVLVVCDGEPVPDSHIIDPSRVYVASLIEGYDIATIRDAYQTLLNEPASEDTSYVKKRLHLTRTGQIEIETASLSLAETALHVEDTIVDTCREFGLLNDGDSLLVALSGGVDSSSLLLALASAAKRLPKFRLVAVTFEDFDSSKSSTFAHAASLAKSLEVEHHLAPASLAQEIFHLRMPLKEVLPLLMKTSASHQTMYIDHHTTRRVLEVVAEKLDLNRIALGLHTTDLVAGLLNAFMSGYNMASLPLREVDTTTYIFPLAFVTKRELHLYHLFRTGNLAQHSQPNPWEMYPTDRNFYYYLADNLQSYWPGLEVLMFTAHQWRLRRQRPLSYIRCRNCGSALLEQPFTNLSGGECDVCAILRAQGFLTEEAHEDNCL